MTRGPISPARWSASTRLILLAGLGVFFAADDQTSVVALLPSMISDLGVAQDEFYQAAWIINGYILGYVMILPLIARASDAIGLGRGYAVALAVFCFGSAWVALSGDLAILTIARLVQAVGSGAVLPISLAMVTILLPRDQRPLGLGAIAAASEIGALIGPLWGAAIASIAGWRAVFWINLPMCLPVAAALWWLTPSIPTDSWKRIDFAGALLFGAALLCLAVSLTDNPVSRRPQSLTFGLWVASVVLLILFVAVQKRSRWPTVQISKFRSPPLGSALAANCLLGGALAVALINVPLFTNTVLRGSALEGGINLTRLSVGLAAGAFLGGVLVRRCWLSAVAALGAVLAGAGYVGMSFWDEDPGFFLMTTPLVISGLGFGLVTVPLATAVLDRVEESERAIWAALLTVVRLLGALVAVALLTSRGLGGFYTEAGGISLSDPSYEELINNLQVETYGDTFLVAAAVCFLALLPIAFIGRARHEPEAEVTLDP